MEERGVDVTISHLNMEKKVTLTFRKMDESSSRQIASWQYAPPYDLYNCNSENIEAGVQNFLKPEYHYYSVWNETGELIGFRCFGEDAQVNGGDYSGAALDMGGGLRPDLTGKGLGADFMNAAFEFACRKFAPQAFRVTVAAFNKRALRVCQKVGYQEIQTFQNRYTGKTFIVLMRDAVEIALNSDNDNEKD